jgi:hypothetical protein
VITVEALIKQKNSWLNSQVDVEFPTAQSVKGRELYQEKESRARYAELGTTDKPLTNDVELHRVDFHRLTILFAQLQSLQWQGEAEQAAILEFFAQLILNDEHALYLAFSNQQMLFAAMVTQVDNLALISDIAVAQETGLIESNQQVASCLAQELPSSISQVWYQD